VEGLNLLDSGHLGTNSSEPHNSHNTVPPSLQDAYEMVGELYSRESYRREVYVSVCSIGDLKDLHMLFERYPDD
jgi:hypothetical protein